MSEAEQTISDEQCRQLAAYAVRSIEIYLRDVRAGCSPHVPEEDNGYRYFTAHYEIIKRIAAGETIAQVSKSLKK